MEKIDLSVKRGETFWQAVRFRENGEPISLEGYTGVCQIREWPDGGKLICEMGVVIAAADGYVGLSLLSAETAVLESGRYVYDFFLESEAGVRTCYFGGRFSVLPAVSEKLN